MEFSISPGRYIVAVSGGVDSVVLLDLLNKKNNLDLIVAHFDHGIRETSHQDKIFVENLARHYGNEFFSERVELGKNSSEEIARLARYSFLEDLRQKTQSSAIITAHHMDDLLETATFNLLRGTGRRGLSSLGSTRTLRRPLLKFTKNDLLSYALKNKLNWVEDITNQDIKYSRNYIRHKLLSGLSQDTKKQFADLLQNSSEINNRLDLEIKREMNKNSNGNKLNRKWFIMLPYDVSTEIMASWLRQNKLSHFDRKTISRSVVSAKTLEPGKKTEIYGKINLEIGKHNIIINR
jgi:tRNA(Ile)-lysidine synthetase-like protein